MVVILSPIERECTFVIGKSVLVLTENVVLMT